jgi:enamine deaminase RidA (YjgF/YER057c/UK114 family)
MVGIPRRGVVIGAAALALLPARARAASTAEVDRRFLAALGRAPLPPSPIGDYVPARRSGQLLYCSTTTARTGGTPIYQGAVGGAADLARGRAAARAAALALLEGVWHHLDGSLAGVSQILNMIGYVASADGFFDQAGVMDGASRAMIEIFGPEAGRASRSAVGVKAMSRNATVSVSAVIELRG